MPPRVLLSWLVPNLSSFQISPVAVTFHFTNSRANTNNSLRISSDSLLLFTLLRIPPCVVVVSGYIVWLVVVVVVGRDS